MQKRILGILILVSLALLLGGHMFGAASPAPNMATLHTMDPVISEPVPDFSPIDATDLTPPDGMFSKRLYTSEDLDPAAVNTYVLNRSSGVFHRPDCSVVDRMNAENRETVIGSRPEMIAAGHTACRICCP